MGAGYIGKTTNSDDDLRGASEQSEREDMWGEMPAKVVSFDAAKQTATVQPLYKKRLDGVATDLPELQERPVRFQRAGGQSMTMPVKAGDFVTLRSQMRNMDGYEGEGFEASSTRSYSLSDMEVHLAGGESPSDPIPNFDPDNVHIRANAEGTYGMRISPDGKFALEGNQGNPYSLIAEAIRLIANDQLQIAYGSSAGTGHALEKKAELNAIADKLEAMAL